ncbi:hypothetical protein GCM10010349_18400 [Streptomyces flavofungini]|nr:hypothetical protein GCM10010349_18400 [Streptomyces flavofungini]
MQFAGEPSGVGSGPHPGGAFRLGALDIGPGDPPAPPCAVDGRKVDPPLRGEMAHEGACLKAWDVLGDDVGLCGTARRHQNAGLARSRRRR